MLQAFQDYYYLRLHKIHNFQPKIIIDQKVGSFRLKTADQVHELKSAFQLRYEIFHNELKGSKNKTGWDIDEFDFSSDHIVIIDEKSNTVAATFRLNSTQHSNQFYSSREFHIDRILKQGGHKTELGRACIKKEYRKGIIISLLWKGIAEYMSRSNSQILFGCASMQVKTARQAALLHRYFFENNKYTAEYFCPPTLAYKMPDFDAWAAHYKRNLNSEEISESELLIPSLCKTYLKMGAFLGGEPAWDEDFNCLDFISVLQAEDLNRSLWKRTDIPFLTPI